MSFIAYDVSLDALRLLRVALAQIAARNPALASQLRRAAASVPLNLAEARSRRGADRTQRCRIAAGSAREVRACLQVACALAQVDDAVAAAADAPWDHVCRLLWPLVR